MVGALAAAKIRCLGGEVDSADEFQDFVHVKLGERRLRQILETVIFT